MADENVEKEKLTRQMRRSENRTLVAVAVIGVASAILGAAVGGYFSNRQSSHQLDAASRQFIHNDKKAAYVDYSKADSDLYDLEYNFGLNFVINNLNPDTRAYLTAQQAKYLAAITHFHEVQYVTYLVESDGVHGKRVQSEDVQYSLQEKIIDVLDNDLDGPVQHRIDVGTFINSQIQERQKRAKAVTDAEREDLLRGT